jgi:hypothetical protein
MHGTMNLKKCIKEGYLNNVLKKGTWTISLLIMADIFGKRVKKFQVHPRDVFI